MVMKSSGAPSYLPPNLFDDRSRDPHGHAVVAAELVMGPDLGAPGNHQVATGNGLPLKISPSNGECLLIYLGELLDLTIVEPP